MSYDDIRTATVIRYPYLWAREARAGETEGRKERPVAVGVRVVRADGDLVLFFPITTKEPEKARFAVEIPAIERRRAGLDADRRLGFEIEGLADEIGVELVEDDPQPPIGVESRAAPLDGGDLNREP
ncbi:hypothetical protein, partial [Mesorhizobium sp. M2A.F.Ca.ET.037.01.1.1]|uniref:hypothetical protein n=1 Tax=Mesorhizobium sp. M2A.F.Ca.ET.037.01.1.1 TaxID=2496748 RepID=UPI001FDFD17B